MQITATLIKGQGTSSAMMKKYDLEKHYENLHFVPTIGTLNLDIDEQDHKKILSLDHVTVNGLKHYKVRVFDRDCYMISWVSHVEILSDIHLKSTYGLENGDTILVTIDAD